MGMSMRKAAAIGVGHGAKQAPVAEPIMLLKLEEALATWLQALGCVRLVHVQRSRLVPDEDDASVSRGWHSHRMQLKLNMHALAIPRSTPMDPFQAESETAEPYWHSAAKLTSELAEGSRLSYIENLDRAERGEWAMMRDSRCHPATHSSAEARAPASEQASGSYVAKYAQELRDGTISFAPASSKESAGGQAPSAPLRCAIPQRNPDQPGNCCGFLSRAREPLHQRKTASALRIAFPVILSCRIPGQEAVAGDHWRLFGIDPRSFGHTNRRRHLVLGSAASRLQSSGRSSAIHDVAPMCFVRLRQPGCSAAWVSCITESCRSRAESNQG